MSGSSRAAGGKPDPATPPVLLGDNLRRTRSERGLSLRELARRLDVSPSLLSQIETGRIQPSVRTLYAIVNELGVSLDEVFETIEPEEALRDGNGKASAPAADAAGSGDDEDGKGVVQRADERSGIDLETGVRWERLTTRDVAGVEFLYLVYPPGSESAPADALIRHSGKEFGFVQAGSLGVTLGFEEHVLGPGDSVCFESSIPHRLHNDGSETVTAVWIVLGRKA
jgi:transcriptional regulator with XRE-family HTH domain